jgi:hypothetical protein
VREGKAGLRQVPMIPRFRAEEDRYTHRPHIYKLYMITKTALDWLPGNASGWA